VLGEGPPSAQDRTKLHRTASHAVANRATFGHAGCVLEYVIRPRDQDAWFLIHAHDLAGVLTPRGWDCEVIEGWGDHRIRVRGAEVAFSGEGFGWQVAVEGDLPRDVADAIVAAITDQIEQACGEPATWVALS
jgi:hypothetical protein